MISTFLSLLITKTNINGILNRGKMFIFSKNQFKNFIGLPDDWLTIDKKVKNIFGLIVNLNILGFRYWCWRRRSNIHFI